MNDIRTVKQKIKECIDKLYCDDKYLFDCDVCERCLMFRLAYYLQNKFTNYFVDCEFDKMGIGENRRDSKVEPNREGSALKRMYADIIIYKRSERTEDNFICIEIKRTKNHISDDVKRLKNMTNQNGFYVENTSNPYLYAYDFGFSIYLPENKREYKIRSFQNGQEVKTVF